MGGGQRPVDADPVSGRHQELDVIEGQVIGWCGRLGSVEADEAGPPVAGDDESASHDLAVGDARPVQGAEVGPRVVENGVGEPRRIDPVHGLSDRVAHDQQGVVTGAGDAHGDQLGDPGPAAGRQQQDQRLVLDLLAPPQADGRAGVLVPDGSPELGEQPGVGAVPADDLDGQAIVVVAQEAGVAPGLHRVQAQPVSRHAEVSQ